MVALTYGEAMLRVFRTRKRKARLEPANPRMPATEVDPNDLVIQGRVVVVLRML